MYLPLTTCRDHTAIVALALLLGEELSKVLSWLGWLLCIVGLHDFQVIDVTLTFGAGGTVEKLECRRCGLTKTQRA